MPKPVPPQRFEAYRALYDAGWLDERIGNAFGLSRATICQWRRANGLPALIEPQKIDRAFATSLYEEGLSDGEMGRALGVTQSGVTRWRQRFGLAPNIPRPSLTETQKRSARKLLRQGQTARDVGAAVGCSKQTIMRLRRGMNPKGLRKTGVTNLTIARRLRKDASVLPRIERAVGQFLPPHIREDAISELYVAVLSGQLAIDQIETQAASYRSKAWDMCGSAFSSVRLDEEDENGLRLVDCIPDPSTLDYA